jgi:hypothetical protein
VYQLLGDWFAWLVIALLVFVMMQMVRLRGPRPGFEIGDPV